MESIQTISKIPEAKESLFFGELLVAKGLLSRDELLDECHVGIGHQTATIL